MLNKSVLLGTILVVSLFLIPSVFAATTYTLNTDNTEILEDVRILVSAPDTNQNTLDLGVQIQNDRLSSFLKYNLTSLPTGKIVKNATFCGFTFEVYNGGVLLHSRHVANYTWTEETITWNTNPCTAGNCNTTIQGVQGAICSNGAYCCVDVTNGVKKDYDLGYMNTSFFINTTEQSPVKNCMFRDKETGTNPYLNVTLEDPPTTTTSSTTSTTSTTTTTEQTTTTEEETTTTINYAEECGINCTENPFTEVGESCDICLRDFEEVYSCDTICGGEENVCDPNFYCEEYLQMGYQCGCCCKNTEPPTTTTTVCPSPTGRCCFIGDVTGDCCLDDNFLYQQIIYSVNGTSYFFNQTTFCANGCDEGLNSCSIPNFWGYGIILIFVILIMLGLKWLRVW